MQGVDGRWQLGRGEPSVSFEVEKKNKKVDVWIPGCGRVATLNLELSPMMQPGAGKLRT